MPLSVTLRPPGLIEKTAPASDTGPPLVLFFRICSAPTCSVLVYVHSMVSFAARLKLAVRVPTLVVNVDPLSTS